MYTVAYKYILIYARTYIKNTHLYKVLGYFRVCPTNSTGDRIEETWRKSGADLFSDN